VTDDEKKVLRRNLAIFATLRDAPKQTMIDVVNARVAQSVEQPPCKRQVARSNRGREHHFGAK
jgi:hypothetical protein